MLNCCRNAQDNRRHIVPCTPKYTTYLYKQRSKNDSFRKRRKTPLEGHESTETFQPSIRCSPLSGLQNMELFEDGAEKTAPCDMPNPNPVPTDSTFPATAPPSSSTLLALGSPPPQERPGIDPPNDACAVAAAAAAASALRRWCHSAHDVVGKARLSHGISPHRTAITCVFVP